MFIKLNYSKNKINEKPKNTHRLQDNNRHFSRINVKIKKLSLLCENNKITLHYFRVHNITLQLNKK